MKATKYTKETILDIGVFDRGFPKFKGGDVINVTVKIVEGGKERLQDFIGTVIKIKGAGITKTFTVRKITDGVAIERIFPYFSPIISALKIVSRSVVRRSKVYYMRDRYGRNSEMQKINVKKTITTTSV